MNVADSWQDQSILISYLGKQLCLGRLAIVLGAGVSGFYGLPQWTELINKLCDTHSEKRMADGNDPLLKAEAIKNRYYADDPAGFARAVKNELYRGLTGDFELIRKNDLLSAVGALAMSSSRGSASTIVTFNYDDLLELFLEYHGYITASVDDAKHWSPGHDVVVYHPHGMLPLLNGERQITSSGIVLGTSDYLTILGNSAENLWRPLLQTLFRTHTFLYIGLSGADIHMQSLVHDLRNSHVVTKDRVRYHGVRFNEAARANEDLISQYDAWGVYTHKVDDFEADLPKFLFAVCQAARVHRSQSI